MAARPGIVVLPTVTAARVFPARRFDMLSGPLRWLPLPSETSTAREVSDPVYWDPARGLPQHRLSLVGQAMRPPCPERAIFP